ncbi:RecB family exonuclease [candidate division KSB1 bacterium]
MNSIQKLRKQPHLSSSGIGDYTECSLSYMFGRIDCLKSEFTSDAMLFGTAIHSVLESFYSSLEAGMTMTLKELQVLFEEIWQSITEIRDDIQYSKGKDYNILLLEGKELLSVYCNNLPEYDYTILGIEKSFIFQIEGVPINIIGVMDLVIEDDEKVITIIDHKTSSRAFSIEEVNKNFQMSLYNLAAQQTEYTGSEILLRFDTLIKTRKPKFESYYTSRSEEDDRRTIKQVQAVWEGISKEVFIPNPNSWKCNYCQFANACNDWFLSEAA